MKKIYLLIALSFFIKGNAQFNSNAPWMQSNTTQKNQEATFNELVNSFETYWQNRDYKKKASGYKPFKRWENYWKNLVNDQGKVITPQEVWQVWEQKKQAKLSRNAASAAALPPSNWTPIGPFTHTNTGSWSSGQGRVNFVYVDPTTASTIYVGSPAGGIWRSTDNGSTWSPLSDNLPQIGVSGIAVDHTNSNVIYIATGDKDATDTYSIGVLKSIDGGVTWNTTGLTFAGTSTTAGDLIMHPTNNQILWCATSVGLYKTSNGGTTWAVTQAGDFAQGSIRLKPADPTTVYAVNNNRFYRSTNTGDTFSMITTGLPINSGRLILDITPANANYIYILSATTGNAFQGIYRSVNGGTNWTKTSGATDVFEGTQAWYDLALATSTTNADEIFTGCLNVWKSINGGVAVTKVNNWNAPATPSYTHADIHFLRYYGNKLFAGTDGGIYVSSDNGASFTSLTAGLQTSQFYKIAVSKQSAGKMVGGLQDNGGHAFSSNTWKNYYGADGMDTAIDPNNSNKFYGFIQQGGGLYISSDAGNTLGSSVNAPTGETGDWVTPLTINGAGELFSGFSKLFKLSGSAWVQQNTTNIGASNIQQICVDPSNDNNMFISKGTALWKSTNKGVTFANVYTAPSTITSICVNYSDSNIVYLTTSGTGGQALKSTTGGTAFVSFSTNLPAIAKNVIKHQGRHSLNPLYIGTTLGVYYRDDSMSQWEPFDTNLPNVSVQDLEINLEDSIITAATYGLEIWKSPVPIEGPLHEVKLKSIQNPTLDINCGGTISPQVTVKNNGTNPITSVSITYDYNASPQNYVWNGTIAPAASQIIDLPSFNVATRGAYNLSINTTITGDAYSDNNQGVAPFYVNNAGTIGVLNTFESASDNLLAFTDGTTSSLWQRGVRTGGTMASGGSNVYTTNFSGNYPDLTKAYLFSQCYNLTSVINPQIRFNMKFDLEQDWDLVYVEYSTNMGQTWSVLGTQGANWYNSSRTPATSGTDCYNCVGAQWTGTDTTARDYFYPLNSLIGQPNVIFRIVFHSDESANQLGVNIDNFIIEGTLSTQDFELKNIAIFPNPSTGVFNISTGNKAIDKVEVYDVTGKVVLSLNDFSAANSQTALDLRGVSSGIYFVKISSENQNTVKRIIKN